MNTHVFSRRHTSVLLCLAAAAAAASSTTDAEQTGAAAAGERDGGEVLSHMGLNHNPTWQRNRVTTCNNNDIVLREDLDEAPCLTLENWATNIADAEMGNPGATLQFVVEVQSDFGSFPGMFESEPCIDLAGPAGASCPDPCGASGPGNLHLKIKPHHFGQAVVTVKLRDNGPCGNAANPNAVCTPARCCESHPVEFQVTVVAVNDCPEFQFRGVTVDDARARQFDAAPATAGDGGVIRVWEDEEFCERVLVNVGYGGWNEGPGELGSNTEPWHDQVLVWSVSVLNQQSAVFKTLPHVRYIEGEDYAELCFLPHPDVSGEVNITIHLEDTGGNVADTVGMAAPCTTAGPVGCYIRSPDENVLIHIREVNDPPTFRAGPGEVVVLEDAGPYARGWASDVRAGPKDEVDAGQQLSHFEVELLNPNHRALFKTLPALDLSGRLTFETLRNANTRGIEVRCAVRLMDYPPARLGLLPAYSAKPDPTFRIIVTPVNDPPRYVPLQPKEVTVWEEEANVTRQWVDPELLCAGWDPLEERCIPNEGSGTFLLGTETHQGEGQTISFNTVPKDPTLFDGEPYVNATGALVFAPAPDANGATQVAVSAVDSGGTASGGDNRGPDTSFLLTVLPVNDPPRFDVRTLAVRVDEDSGAYDEAAFLYNVAPGPADERDQVVSVSVRVSNPALFADEPALVLDAMQSSAALRFTPAKDAFGSASVFFHLSDDGGDAAGGDPRADGHEVVVTVSPVNDPPSATLGAHVVVDEDAYPSGYSQVAWVREASPGPREERVQYLTYDVSCGAGADALFRELPTVTPKGTLRFAARADAFGTVVCEAAPCDVDAATDERLGCAEAAPFNVGVLPVNDPPRFGGGRAVRVDECRTAAAGGGGCPHALIGWAENVTAGPPNEAYQRLTFTLEPLLGGGSGGVMERLFEEGPAVDAAGTLRFRLRPGEFLQPAAEMRATLRDDGGGASDSHSVRWTLEVVPGGPAPPGPPAAARVVVLQQPSVDGGALTPASFEVRDGSGAPVVGDALWRFALVDAAGVVRHTQVVARQGTATALYTQLAAAGTGTFTVRASVEPAGSGGANVAALTANTAAYTVASEGGAVSAALMRSAGEPAAGGAVSQREVEAGEVRVNLRIEGGDGSWDEMVLQGISLTLDTVSLTPRLSLLSSTELRIGIPPDATSARNSTLELVVPAGATGAGSPRRTFTFRVLPTPRVRVTLLPPSTTTTGRAGAAVLQQDSDGSWTLVDEADFAGDGVVVALEVSGDEWRAGTAAEAVEASVTPVEGAGGAAWGSRATATRASGREVLLRIRNRAGQPPAAGGDAFALDAAALAPGLETGAVPVWDGGVDAAFRLRVRRPEAPAEPGVSGAATAAAVLTAVLAWMLALAAPVAAVVAGSLGPPALLALLVLPGLPARTQPQLEVASRTSLLWCPFGVAVDGSSTVGATLVLAALLAVAGAAVPLGALRLLRRRLRPSWGGVKAKAFLCVPSVPLALAACGAPALVRNGLTSLLWGGARDAYRGAGAEDAAGAGARVGAALVAVAGAALVVAAAVRAYRRSAGAAWFAKAGPEEEGSAGASSGASGVWVSPPELRAVERYGSVFRASRGAGTAAPLLAADLATLVALPAAAAVADPAAGALAVRSGSLRAALFLAAAVLGGRAAVVVAVAPHRVQALRVLDAVASLAGSLSVAVLLLSTMLVSDAKVGGGYASHWTCAVAAVLLLLALAAAVAAVVLHLYLSFPPFRRSLADRRREYAEEGGNGSVGGSEEMAGRKEAAPVPDAAASPPPPAHTGAASNPIERVFAAKSVDVDVTPTHSRSSGGGGEWSPVPLRAHEAS